MATTTGLTVKEFLAQQLPEDQRCELIHGEIVPMGNAKYRHERVKANANEILVSYLIQNPIGKVHNETMYQLTETDALQPDLSILLKEQVPTQAPDDLLELAPALVLEVVSSESAANLEQRVELFLERGTRAVLVAFTTPQVIRIFEPSGHARLVRGDQKLELDLLPGFSVPASRFFEGL
ncbi:MAG: Uma2 family endonuclease [Acidobacteria bacterium]|nr:Uma2 family endonuclease [Acidobacteriota bacterium]